MFTRLDIHNKRFQFFLTQFKEYYLIAKNFDKCFEIKVGFVSDVTPRCVPSTVAHDYGILSAFWCRVVAVGFEHFDQCRNIIAPLDTNLQINCSHRNGYVDVDEL